MPHCHVDEQQLQVRRAPRLLLLLGIFLIANCSFSDGAMSLVTRSIGGSSCRNLAKSFHSVEHIRTNRHHTPRSVRLKVGGSGHVNLTLLKSKAASDKESPNNILVVLRPGPALQAGLLEADVLYNNKQRVSRLSEALPLTTIAVLNYRLSSPKHLYPIPIHDTATAFTYIANPSSAHNAGRVPRISLYGSHIGGSLALMLALTSPNLIDSLAALEPVVDWTGLDERKSRAKNGPTQDATVHLLNIRSQLFRSPSVYFDPFASPILFLRAPGRDTPASHSSLVMENEEDLYPATNTDADTDAFGPYDDEHISSTLSSTSPKRRKVLRRWPPLSRPEESTLPYVKLMLREGGGLSGVLREQGKEMADCMQKACFFGREKGFGEARVKTEILQGSEAAVDDAVLRIVGDPRDTYA